MEEPSSTPRADAYLIERGITKETITQNGVELRGQSLENRVLPADYRRLLHFDNWDQQGKLKLHEIIEESIWFPCRNENGTTQSVIVRVFPSLPGKNGSGDAKFITPKDGNGYPFIPTATWKVKGKPHVPLLITEGPMKALAALQVGAYPIGLGGVWMATEKIGESGATALHPVLLEHFTFRGRVVYIAFDADFLSNPRVGQALIRTTLLLFKAGAEVKIPIWPLKDGKGLDDYLAKNTNVAQQRFEELCATAKDLGSILEPGSDLDTVIIEAARAQLTGVKLTQFCRIVAPRLNVPAAELGKEIARKTRTVNEWAHSRNGSDSERSGPPDYIEKLVTAYGTPFFLKPARLNDRFWARLYQHENDLIHYTEADQFYKYSDKTGLYAHLTRAELAEELQNRIYSAATNYGSEWEKLLELCNSGQISGTITNLAGITEVRNPFQTANPVIICTNKLIRFGEKYEIIFEGFDPKWRKRHGSPFAYEPDAQCPLFLKHILGHVSAENALVLQKYAGQCLIGRNLIQRFAILDGVGAASKTEFIRTICGIVGTEACAELRTEQLGGRFEIGNICYASLLYGPDVAGNFLNQPGAKIIKSLVGGELLDCEFKGSNLRGKIEGVLNILISSNARLRVFVDSDRSAWARRLLVIRYDAGFGGIKIPEIHVMLLREEGPGILNWCIQGAKMLLADIQQFGDVQLSISQRGLIDKMLNESDSLRLFLKARVVQDSKVENGLASEELTDGYGRYCQIQGWDNLTMSVITRRLPDHMMELFKVLPSNRIEYHGKSVRGYRQVRWRTASDDKDE